MMTMTEDIAGFAAAFSLKTAPTELLRESSRDVS